MEDVMVRDEQTPDVKYQVAKVTFDSFPEYKAKCLLIAEHIRNLQNKVNRVFAATESCDYTRLYKLRADGGKVNFPDAPDRMFLWNEDVNDIPDDQFRKIIDIEHYYTMVNEKLKGWPQDVYG